MAKVYEALRRAEEERKQRERKDGEEITDGEGRDGKQKENPISRGCHVSHLTQCHVQI